MFVTFVKTIQWDQENYNLYLECHLEHRALSRRVGEWGTSSMGKPGVGSVVRVAAWDPRVLKWLGWRLGILGT